MATIGQITGVMEKGIPSVVDTRELTYLSHFGYNSCLRTEVEVDIDQIKGVIIQLKPKYYRTVPDWCNLSDGDPEDDKEFHWGEFLEDLPQAIATAIEKGGVIRVVEK